ncbi:hypothetical protein SERLA73DRAFT_191980 [Serpula lacrymans var. lacrymans S7.3]|uniref:Signal recognition particle subunit SRP72 n=2 Tax=Serpula lacrymans var. lacrymans TaxID=341189 RepID=F8QIR0_SERL3|nr:uncharacterized protein SERLADRAFT_462709 [Serpula lacrymans var. lacrymans S7.9]EGN91808.1 hypothetical protein SERLA73DRAFT_191980 [Serpula lacrymans var. lacrymans S7.3]EGO26064.1 hypothetical protein SERLADRAFT_462709 [Serpula lacrymans var. lacrymans S7.9]
MGPSPKLKPGSTNTSNRSKPAAAQKTTSNPPAKQPISLSERLKRLFTSLCAQIDGGHFSNAIKTCDKILRLEPEDKDASQTKLFLLLQTEQYGTALSLVNTDHSDSKYAFERAYAMYRLQHEPEAASVLDDIKKAKTGERGVLHLEAQLNYRQGSYQTALDLYGELLETAESQSEEYSDILTNLDASQKHLDFINKGFLQALDALPASLTAALEISPPPLQATTSAATALAIPAVDVGSQPEDESIRKIKKVRMSRVPKGVVPGVTPPPDPERWLKKSERSTFGQGNRKRKGGGATQGSVADSAPAININHGAKSSSGGHSKGKKRK